MTESGPNDTIRITGVCGSLSSEGATKKALAVALQGAAEYDAETTLLELRDFNLVFYGSVPPDEYPPDVIRLRKALKSSQGIILATPEYHGSLTGALKNMLDLMSMFLSARKALGMTGFLLALIHALMSFMLFSPKVYAQIIQWPKSEVTGKL